MNRIAMNLLACLLLLMSPGCRSTDAPTEGHQAEVTEVLEPFECGTITRLHTYQGVFLASQPSPEDLEQAKAGGVVTVVSLRHASEHPDFDEKHFVEGLGLRYINIPWNGADELTDAVFDRARDVLRNEHRPVLMHCSSANRVGAVWLPWRVLDGCIEFEEALAEAKIIGLRSPAYEEAARAYIERIRRSH
ncbi:hypothetical protein OT109_05325 [Phycisphaeraceae bacterium D3-23]